jgi:hypothetical protein
VGNLLSVCVQDRLCCMELVSQLVIGLGIWLPVRSHGIMWLEWCNSRVTFDIIDKSA